MSIPESLIPTEEPSDGKTYSPQLCLAWINNVLYEGVEPLALDDMTDKLCQDVTSLIVYYMNREGIEVWNEYNTELFGDHCDKQFGHLEDDELIYYIVRYGKIGFKIYKHMDVRS